MIMCASSLTACKMPFSGKGGNSEGKHEKVEVTPGYLSDKISYLAAEKVAKNMVYQWIWIVLRLM